MPVATHGSRELRERIVQHSSFTENDFTEISRCRRDHNQLGFRLSAGVCAAAESIPRTVYRLKSLTMSLRSRQCKQKSPSTKYRITLNASRRFQTINRNSGHI